ncbi:hypothetical protein J8I87_30340 [Paraburkholderia sp. LEh10]|uniref:hypothetical protein n=1 Tax=Paraburkholderia sp. LEh10 TaxID=2821353 RepID=UPI001AE7F0E1|nr:hypothetical protein [Paraburkholderia sp. LEh10]MBP0593904.1 hypothetical protein [Paraburkholderia sp. LEh10]
METVIEKKWVGSMGVLRWRLWRRRNSPGNESGCDAAESRCATQHDNARSRRAFVTTLAGSFVPRGRGIILIFFRLF